jgi:hypothetical protein
MDQSRRRASFLFDASQILVFAFPARIGAASSQLQSDQSQTPKNNARDKSRQESTALEQTQNSPQSSISIALE